MKQAVIKKIFDTLIYISFILVLVFACRQKVSVNIDEVYSYGLANHYGSKSIQIEDGFKYVPSEEVYYNYVTVFDEHRFDYINVWNNQVQDVHPPLYYCILHTICSLRPRTFSMWYGFFINIGFAIGVLLVIRKIVDLYTKGYFVKSLISLSFIAMTGIYNAVMFIRMYVMAMFFVTLFIYWVFKFIKDKDNFREVSQYIILLLISVGGILTHYYCMVFFGLFTFIYAICLLSGKRIRDALFFCVTMAVSVLLSLIIFPGMYSHFFLSGRGTESFEHFAYNEKFVAQLSVVANLINKHIFGGLFPILIFIALLGLIVALVKKKIEIKAGTDLIVTVVPSLMYFVLISRIAPYGTDRYYFPIYGVLFVIFILSLSRAIKVLTKGTAFKVILAAILVVVSVNGWLVNEWSYSEKYTEDAIKFAREHSDLDCVFLYERRTRTHPAFFEVKNYNSVTFANCRKEIPDISTMRPDGDFVFIVPNTERQEEILDLAYKDGYICEYVGTSGYSNTFWCHQGE
jgi:hypothetical protein